MRKNEEIERRDDSMRTSGALVALKFLARIPAKWNRFAEKDSRQINMLEQILVAKVFNFGGICSKAADGAAGHSWVNFHPDGVAIRDFEAQ